MLKKLIFLILLPLVLIACSDEQKTETPAQEQIDEYTKDAEECKDKEEKDNKENSEQKTSSMIDKKEEIRGFYAAKDDMVLGDPSSQVVLVEYFSPTCPHCVLFHKSIFPVLNQKYIETKKIAYIVREFVGNKQDLDAAILARCKGDSTSYFKFVEVLLQQQNNWAMSSKYREILTNIGSLGGVAADNYAKCLLDENLTKILIENTNLAAKSRGFVGTPAFFINGKQFNKPYTADELSNAIEIALKELQK